MRIFIVFLLLAATPLSLFSQSSLVKQKAKSTMMAYHQIYQFSELQQTQVLDIQEEYFEKVLSLDALKNTDYDRYLLKKDNLQSVCDRSIYKLLNDQQRNIYAQQQKKRAKQEAELKARLKKEGASMAEIKRALLELE